MGKFFDAMQRATGVEEETPAAAPDPNALPELDDRLLEPERSDAGEPFPEAVETKHSTDPALFAEEIMREAHEAKIRMVPPVQTQEAAHEIPAPRRPMAPSKVRDKKAPELVDEPVILRRSVDTGVYRSPVHAAYERIIQRLQEYRKSPRQSIIHFSSAVAGEGTSTVARNTAVVLARHETDQVLLIDANLRTPSQHRAFGVEREPGLSDILMGASKVASVIRGDVAEKLALITAGAVVPSPAQLLSVPALQSVMMSLLSLYDWIVIDGPPVTSFPDSMSLAGAAGGAVLVVRAEKTRSEVAEEAVKNLESTGVDVLGAVLNERRFHIPEFVYKKL